MEWIVIVILALCGLGIHWLSKVEVDFDLQKGAPDNQYKNVCKDAEQ
jgi:hypothetical protein